jgi:hypothetical protein
MTDASNDAPVEVVEEHESEEQAASYISAPKLMRIASMTRALLDEVRQSELDDPGRRRLAEIHERSLEEMQEVLSEDLREELTEMFTPLEGDISESELRIVQAQLVGWLEGLFAGIQATLISQQAAAANQLQEMRMRAIEAQGRRPGSDPGQDVPGQYL